MKSWLAYKAALRQRGDIQIWISGDLEAHWTEPRKRTPGGCPVYADFAIETKLALRSMFHRPRRQSEGLDISIFHLMGSDLSVPGHSTLTRRWRGRTHGVGWPHA